MEDPYGPAHRARSRRQRGIGGRPRFSLSAIAVPTAVLVVGAAVVAGGATAAMRGGLMGAGNQNQAAQGMTQAQMANAQMQPMIAPRLKGKAKKQAAAQQAAPAAAQAAQQAATANPNCTLIVPANPLTAQGLATPYQLVATNPANGPCNEANANQSAFVQGAIVTANGQLTLYDPLVIDQGTQPISPPVVPNVPAGSTVAVWFGFNGTNLTLANAAGTNSLQQGNCVNGLQGSIFGQFASCNGPAFFQAANTVIQANMLQIPAQGTANDGLPCPTVRDFSLVDQDQSDNVDAHYLAAANGQTGPANAATRAALQQQGQNNPTDLANGSDNRLLNVFVAPALGCQPFMRPNGAMDGQASPSLPLNELQAALFQAAPVALVPMNDPMAQVNGAASTAKTNLFRAAVNQGLIGAAGDAGDGAAYCSNLFTNPMGIQRVFKDMAMLQNAPSPDPAAASNLFTFLAMRGQGSFENLGCGALLKTANPIQTTLTNGVVTAATFTPGGAAAANNNNGAANQANNGTAANQAANGMTANGTAANPTATATMPAAANGAANGTTAGAPAAAPTPTATSTKKHKKHHH